MLSWRKQSGVTSRPCRARCDGIVFIHQDDSLTSCQGLDEIRIVIPLCACSLRVHGLHVIAYFYGI